MCQKKPTKRSSDNRPHVCYPSGIRREIARKRCLWRLMKTDPDSAKVAKRYRLTAEKCKRLMRNFEIKKEQAVIDNNNQGSFFRFVNKKLTCKKGVSMLRSKDGTMIVDDKQRADLLNEYFSSVCTVDDNRLPVIDHINPTSVQIDSVIFTPLKVAAAIKKLKPNQSSGPDGLVPLLFKNLSQSLAGPLSLLFSAFMSVGRIPGEWKKAIITPVYKNGDSSDVSNYRPIALTNVICKIMERVICADLLAYLRHYGVINKHQHGFLAGKSTTTNLLECLNDWTLAIKNKHSVAVAYIDYSKAFDSVCHSKLLTKLCAYGITGNLLSWIDSFLSGRSQRTRIGSSLSNEANIISGVIQGSVLGPLLFLLFINDVCSIVSNDCCVCKLYADDLKLYTVLQADEDASVLQDRLNALGDWSNTWQLTISHKKCAAMTINEGECKIQLRLENDEINIVNEIKDLGIYVSNDLKFGSHINRMVAKASARANLIFKCFVSRDTATLIKAFKTYVRPILEYSSSVWSPVYRVEIDRIESVQRRFTKRLPGFAKYDYETRLSLLDIDSLELRRLFNDLILVYKMLFKLIDVNVDDFFDFTDATHDTRGHEYKLYVNHCRINARKHFFPNGYCNRGIH